MTAELYNIGKPRAFGHAQGLAKMGYRNPYKEGTTSYRQFTDGYFEGDDKRYASPVIIPPDLPLDQA